LQAHDFMTRTIPATYVKKRGFVCGNHVLYCPDLSKVSSKMPFYLYCGKHKITYAIDIFRQSAEFIRDFPCGCKASLPKVSSPPKKDSVAAPWFSNLWISKPKRTN